MAYNRSIRELIDTFMQFIALNTIYVQCPTSSACKKACTLVTLLHNTPLHDLFIEEQLLLLIVMTEHELSTGVKVCT